MANLPSPNKLKLPDEGAVHALMSAYSCHWLACTHEGTSMENLNLLVSLITEDNDYQREQAASAQSAAGKLGARVQIIYANNDAVQQTLQILQFVQEPAKRPDAILVEPVGTGMPQVAKAASRPESLGR